MRVAIYARVSTSTQSCETQLGELRAYVAARRWTPVREYTDEGVSGSKETRPALDLLLRDARRRRIDVVCFWSLDRLGRSLKNLITLLDEFQSLGIAFVSLREGLDGTSSAGRLQWQVIAAFGEFERNRISERVRAGLQRVKASGKRLGRPQREVPESILAPVRGLSVRAAARQLGVSSATAHRWLSHKTSPKQHSKTH